MPWGGVVWVTHDAHVRYGFLVLGRTGALPSLAVMLRGRQIHELDGVDHHRLGFGIVRQAFRVAIYVILQTVQAGKHLEHRPSASQTRRAGDFAHSPWEGRGLGPSSTPYNCPGRGGLRIAMGNRSSPPDVRCTCAPSQVITTREVVGVGLTLWTPLRLSDGRRTMTSRDGLCLFKKILRALT